MTERWFESLDTEALRNSWVRYHPEALLPPLPYGWVKCWGELCCVHNDQLSLSLLISLSSHYLTQLSQTNDQSETSSHWKSYKIIRKKITKITKCVYMFLSVQCITARLCFRYELHPGVCGSWGVWGILPIPLENEEQSIPCWAPDAEPAGHLCVGADLLHPLQEEDLLEDLNSHHITISHTLNINPPLESGDSPQIHPIPLKSNPCFPSNSPLALTDN